jgi:hypothetical protein
MIGSQGVRELRWVVYAILRQRFVKLLMLLGGHFVIMCFKKLAIRWCKIFITLKKMHRKLFSAYVTLRLNYAKGCVIALEHIRKNISN